MRTLAVWGTVVSCLAGIFASPVLAAPPEGADPAFAPWFKSLTQPRTQQPCCSLADCRTVRYRTLDDHFQVYIGDDFPRWSNPPHEWVDVPNANVLHRLDNPTGEGVACWFQGQVVCFVEGNGT
jgi:hypothetical protein